MILSNTRGGNQKETKAGSRKQLQRVKWIPSVTRKICLKVVDGLQTRYEEIVNGLTPFLRTCGYNPKKDVIFLPMSGLLGHNIVKGVKDTVAPWYQTPRLLPGPITSTETQVPCLFNASSIFILTMAGYPPGRIVTIVFAF
jgi:sulfate adenylyltransferase subunit 1 (EFTu-like GTPase family)